MNYPTPEEVERIQKDQRSKVIDNTRRFIIDKLTEGVTSFTISSSSFEDAFYFGPIVEELKDAGWELSTEPSIPSTPFGDLTATLTPIKDKS